MILYDCYLGTYVVNFAGFKNDVISRLKNFKISKCIPLSVACVWHHSVPSDMSAVEERRFALWRPLKMHFLSAAVFRHWNVLAHALAMISTTIMKLKC